MGATSKEGRNASRRAALRGLLVWGRRVGLTVLAGLFIWGSIEVRARVRADPRFAISDRRLVVGELPAWAPEELRRDVEELRVGNGAESMFVPGALARLRDEILLCPWVRNVSGLRLRAPGIGRSGGEPGWVSADGSDGEAPDAPAAPPVSGWIDLALELRVPIAAVAAGGSLYLTDREAVRLGPPISPERARELRVPAIIGGETGKPRRAPAPGAGWEDRDVREGLEVAKVLHDEGIGEQFPASPIEAIDIANVADRARPGECEVYLTSGRLRLGWGRSPISAGARTLPVPEIVSNLKWVLSRKEKLAHLDLVRLYTRPIVGVPRART